MAGGRSSHRKLSAKEPDPGSSPEHGHSDDGKKDMPPHGLHSPDIDRMESRIQSMLDTSRKVLNATGKVRLSRDPVLSFSTSNCAVVCPKEDTEIKQLVQVLSRQIKKSFSSTEAFKYARGKRVHCEAIDTDKVSDRLLSSMATES